MTEALIVAASADADFAKEVRDKTRGLAIEIAPTLAAGEQRPVLLVWSAASSVAATTVPALAELRSRGRLVIARRDGTELPGGLEHCEALLPDAPAREAAFRLLQAAFGPGRAATPEPVESSPAPPAAVAIPDPPAPEPQRGGAGWLIAVAFVVVLIIGGTILGSLGP
jgi:hypothetical protein